MLTCIGIMTSLRTSATSFLLSERIHHTPYDHPSDSFIRCTERRPEQVHLPTQILSNTKVSLHCQISAVRVLNGAQESRLFDYSAHCRPSLSAQSPRRGGLTVIHGIFFFHIVEANACSCFQLNISRFLFLQRCLHIVRPLLFRSKTPHAQLGFASSSRRKQ